MIRHCQGKPKIILVPYPAQGHVNPILKLASLFVNYGYESTIVLPAFIYDKVVLQIQPKNEIFQLVRIPDGLENMVTAPDFFAIESAMENNMPSHFDNLVQESREAGGLFCVVVDMLASWAIEVASKYGVPLAGFWPAMLASYRLISAIPDMVCSGLITDAGIPYLVGESIKLPDQPTLSTEDLPWLIGTLPSKKARFKFWTRVLRRSKALKVLLVNSFEDEYNTDKCQVQMMINNGSHNNGGHVVHPIGALCKHSITCKNISFWEEDTSCLQWLDKQKPDSVVYVSFGSWVSPIGELKIRALALALEASARLFIWVLRSDWYKGLPSGFLERVSKQGKVVTWAPQMEVLGHKAVGCYLTHCGWNSTMEAIQCQKRLLCYPVAGDQFVNCRYIVQVWRIGLKLNGFRQKDLEEGLSEVMENTDIKNTLIRLYERIMGEHSISKGLSNLKAFVDDIKRPQLG